MRKLPAAVSALMAALFVAACAAPQVAQIAESVEVRGGPAVGRPNAAPAAAFAQRDAAGAAPNAATEAGSLSDRMIVRTTSLNLNVQKVADAVQDIQTLVNRVGGYVANTRFKNENERSTAVLSVRVPSDRVDAFLREVRGMAVKVYEEGTTSQDVTEEYSDLGAQLRNQEATEAQYLELMKRAQSVDEILKVQQQLTQIRGQIERTKGRIQFLERRADLTQVDITLAPDVAARGSWDAGEVARRAWEASLAALQRVAEVAITVVVFSWWLVPLGAVAYGVGSALRQRRRAEATS